MGSTEGGQASDTCHNGLFDNSALLPRVQNNFQLYELILLKLTVVIEESVFLLTEELFFFLTSTFLSNVECPQSL